MKGFRLNIAPQPASDILIGMLEDYDKGDNDNVSETNRMRIEVLCARIADRNVHL